MDAGTEGDLEAPWLDLVLNDKDGFFGGGTDKGTGESGALTMDECPELLLESSGSGAPPALARDNGEGETPHRPCVAPWQSGRHLEQAGLWNSSGCRSAMVVSGFRSGTPSCQ